MRIIDRSSDVCSSDLLIPEGVFDKVFGQERSSQQAPQLNTRFVDGVSPRRRSKSGQRCNCAGVAAHHRGCQMDQGVPVLLNQSGIDGSLANCCDLRWNDRATRHVQMTLLQFLQSWAYIEPHKRSEDRRVGKEVVSTF